MAGSATEAPPEYAARALQAIGANALAAVAVPKTAATSHPKRIAESDPVSLTQSSLFTEEGAPKVIPFERGIKPPATVRNSEVLPEPKARITGRKPPVDVLQSTLDFLPPSPQSIRTLKTTVEAVIYCDAPVASPIHRATAAVLDAGIIMASFGIFFAIFETFGGGIDVTKQTAALLTVAFGLVALLYGFVWMLSGRETAGMKWTGLKLVNFNGFAPDRKMRALRMTGCALSFCSGMIGIFWALVDEEGLTWHD
ncbi:MAG: RDD family protein, partial [Acidobacteriota bacterium]|nr:RDD family protein [Acidobacteriota bacterium]